MVFQIFIVLLVSANLQDDPVKSELEKLKGTWSVTSALYLGKPEDLKGCQLIIDGTTAIQKIEGQQDMKCTITIDPTKDPKVMDVSLEQGGKKVLIRGIYKLDGDKLTYCSAPEPATADGKPTNSKRSDRPNKVDSDMAKVVYLERKTK